MLGVCDADGRPHVKYAYLRDVSDDEEVRALDRLLHTPSPLGSYRRHHHTHLRRMWHACGEGRCNGRTSVKTRLRALCILLEHGVWAPAAACYPAGAPTSTGTQH